MIPFDPATATAEEILESLRSELGETRLSELIDNPIDRAVEQFECPDAPVAGQSEFLDVVSRFLQQVYALAFPSGRQLPLDQARAEVIKLLQQCGYPAGYRGALWDASRPLGAGVSAILVELTNFLKAWYRRDYVHWLVAVHFDAADWSTKCRIASLILQRWGALQPVELQECTPERFVALLPDLLQQDLGLNSYSPEEFLASLTSRA